MMRPFALAVVVAALVAATAATAASAKPAPATISTADVTGTITGDLGSFTGTFTLDRFVSQNGVLAIVGTLTGQLVDAAGNVIATITETITVPISTTASCGILHLEVGPIDLDLLGLVVHVDKIVVDITAQSGPGNLVGNLLCGIAGLLDSGVPTSVLVNLLNALLGLL